MGGRGKKFDLDPAQVRIGSGESLRIFGQKTKRPGPATFNTLHLPKFRRTINNRNRNGDSFQRRQPAVKFVPHELNNRVRNLTLTVPWNRKRRNQIPGEDGYSMIYPGRDSDPYHIPEIGSRSFKHPGQEVDITYPEKGVDSNIYPGKEGDHSRTRERPVAIYTPREDRRAMFQITGEGRWLYKYPGQRKAIIQVGTRERPVAIRVPGTEEGDRSSRYPEDDGDNPNTRDRGGRSFK